MKNIILIFILLILISSSTNASLEADWLVSKSSNNRWNTIEETAYAVLALKTESTKYSTQISKAVQILKTNLDNCIPNNDCNVKDAALSILAIKDSITNLDTYTTWLLNSRSIQYSGELTGWKVQIISPIPTTCTLKNIETDQQQQIAVQKDYTPWQDISSSVLTLNTKSLNLDCSSVTQTGLILSLIQEKQESGVTYYYIKQEEHNKNNITVEFGNPCWGSAYRSTCDNEITALVLYTLKQTTNKPNDATWLKQQSLTPLQNAYLYKGQIALDQKYFDAVKNSQTAIGDWNQDIAQTAMISYLLKPSSILEKSYSWMNLSRNPQNCWPSLSCDVTTTSLVLMSSLITTTAAFNDADNDGIDDNWEAKYCNGNCDPNADPDKDGLTNLQEFRYNTNPNKADTDGDKYNDKAEIDAGTDPNDPNDYPKEPKKEKCPRGEDCRTIIYNCFGKCDSLGVCIDIEGDNCPESDTMPVEPEPIYGEACTTDIGCDGTWDIYGICQDIKGDSCPSTDTATGAGPAKEPTETPAQGRSTLFWLLLVLLFLIALIGGGYLAYKKGLLKFKFTKKPKPSLPVYTPKFKPSPKTEYRPATKPVSHKSPFRKHIEESLEKSMEEMENLLKK